MLKLQLVGVSHGAAQDSGWPVVAVALEVLQVSPLFPETTRLAHCAVTFACLETGGPEGQRGFRLLTKGLHDSTREDLEKM